MRSWFSAKQLPENCGTAVGWMPAIKILFRSTCVARKLADANIPSALIILGPDVTLR